MIPNIKVKINVVLIEKGVEELKSISIECPNFYKISDLIRQGVDLFNEQFVQEKSKYRFTQIYKNFFFKPSKKNGQPKTDVPSNFLN